MSRRLLLLLLVDTGEEKQEDNFAFCDARLQIVPPSPSPSPTRLDPSKCGVARIEARTRGPTYHHHHVPPETGWSNLCRYSCVKRNETFS